MGCEENEACLAEIAGALGVDELVSGSLSKVDESEVMVIRRIDQNRAKVVGTVDKRLKEGKGQEFLAAVGSSVEELFPEYPLRAGVTRGVPKEMALRLDPPPLPGGPSGPPQVSRPELSLQAVCSPTWRTTARTSGTTR